MNTQLFVLLNNRKVELHSNNPEVFYPQVLSMLPELPATASLRIFYDYNISEAVAQELIQSGNFESYVTTYKQTTDFRKPYLFDARELNPFNKDWNGIPQGPYCYTGRERKPEEPEFDQAGLPIHYIQCCPFFEWRKINGVNIAWCEYLGKGGEIGEAKVGRDYKKEEKALLEHFGTREAIDNALPLMLLFDMCKECGINDWKDEI